MHTEFAKNDLNVFLLNYLMKVDTDATVSTMYHEVNQIYDSAVLSIF